MAKLKDIARCYWLLILVLLTIGIYFEDRNLIEDLGEDYTEYKRTVPGPIPFSKKKDTSIPEALHEAG